MCVVNARVTTDLDDYTSVSHRGIAIVDYFLTTHEGLQYFEELRVINLSDFIAEHDMIDIAGKRPSDHNIVLSIVKLKDTESINKLNPVVNAQTPVRIVEDDRKPPRRYKKGRLPDTYLTSEVVLSKCSHLIEAALERCKNQEELDRVYNDFVTVYHDELSTCLKALDSTPK